MRKIAVIAVAALLSSGAYAQSNTENGAPKTEMNYRSFYTNAEAKAMCEKCDRKVNKGQINESCSVCVGYFRGILSSVEEMNALRAKVNNRVVQICYRTDTIGKIIYNYINYLTSANVKIDGNSYNSFVEFLAKNYPCDGSILTDETKRDAFFENIQKKVGDLPQ